MRIVIAVVGMTDPPAIGWPAAWPAPAKGQKIWVEERRFKVVDVEWLPYGLPDPFVHVVVRPG